MLGIKPIGKGPSYHVIVQKLISMDAPGTAVPWSKFTDNVFTGSTLLPGGTYITPIHSDFMVTQEMIDSYNAGTKVVIVLSQIDYTDWFGIWHKSRICLISIPTETRLGFCRNADRAA
jgi:hypothetical protein